MNVDARAVADAVLYEGFLLFPYAKSALKNRMPFQFGVVMPEGYQDPSESSAVRAQFVFCPDSNEANARIEGAVRFLRVREDPVEEEVPFAFSLDAPFGQCFTAGNLRGEIDVESDGISGVARVTIDIVNRTSTDANAARNDALHEAFVSAHVLLEGHGGSFASMLDPPVTAMAIVAGCRNERLYPILTGERTGDGQTSRTLLLSPIILEDFPRIAPASRGQTFDGTEIDELLLLSVASLTDEEKHEARSAHPYVRTLVERAEALDAKTLQTLHGEITIGTHVRVVPNRRADVWDDVVRGMSARVNAIQTDLEGKHYVGVVFDADPASDLHDWYGRSFFYGVDELELLP